MKMKKICVCPYQNSPSSAQWSNFLFSSGWTPSHFSDLTNQKTHLQFDQSITDWGQTDGHTDGQMDVKEHGRTEEKDTWTDGCEGTWTDRREGHVDRWMWRTMDGQKRRTRGQMDVKEHGRTEEKDTWTDGCEGTWTDRREEHVDRWMWRNMDGQKRRTRGQMDVTWCTYSSLQAPVHSTWPHGFLILSSSTGEPRWRTCRTSLISPLPVSDYLFESFPLSQHFP